MTPRKPATQAHIKAFYLRTHSLEEWQAVSRHPGAFNQVWRRMLSLPPSHLPPPADYR